MGAAPAPSFTSWQSPSEGSSSLPGSSSAFLFLSLFPFPLYLFLLSPPPLPFFSFSFSLSSEFRLHRRQLLIPTYWDGVGATQPALHPWKAQSPQPLVPLATPPQQHSLLQGQPHAQECPQDPPQLSQQALLWQESLGTNCSACHPMAPCPPARSWERRMRTPPPLSRVCDGVGMQQCCAVL